MFPIANGVPLRYSPVATWALIAANCVIFLSNLASARQSSRCSSTATH